MKKASLSIATALLLAGCAGPNQGIGLYQLETAPYMREDRKLPMDFVQIQRAVFKQQARCGSTLQFKVDEQHPSYARVTQPLVEGAAPEDWDKQLVLGLTLLQNSSAKILGVTLREGDEPSTRARLYSYYAPGKERVRAIYNALLHPDLCPGETPPEKPEEKEGSRDR
ncbi:hypothetical protein CSC67_19420 [Pusillimonas caeni]|uniref:hypothetical protein n=1 Tax=Pusillimonas caeni TaxID=1348472 RepID=UPI000E59CE04|nr:hypothetical protein [Pusillimonas caeni]TFL09290.1 hypothetical protein CSC67_19420 [Pusillimonas caeni]